MPAVCSPSGVAGHSGRRTAGVGFGLEGLVAGGRAGGCLRMICVGLTSVTFISRTSCTRESCLLPSTRCVSRWRGLVGDGVLRDGGAAVGSAGSAADGFGCASLRRPERDSNGTPSETAEDAELSESGFRCSLAPAEHRISTRPRGASYAAVCQRLRCGGQNIGQPSGNRAECVERRWLWLWRLRGASVHVFRRA